MSKKIFKSFSFQQAREGENLNCDPDVDNSSCCPDNYVSLMTIIDHIDEAECFELMVEELDVPIVQERTLNEQNEDVLVDLEGGGGGP